MSKRRGREKERKRGRELPRAKENELHSVRTELRVEKAAMRSFQRSAGNDEEALAQRVLKDQVDMKDRAA